MIQPSISTVWSSNSRSPPTGAVSLAGTEYGAVAVWDGKAAEATITEVAADEVGHRKSPSPPTATLVATGSLSLDVELVAQSPIRLWRFDGVKLVRIEVKLSRRLLVTAWHSHPTGIASSSEA